MRICFVNDDFLTGGVQKSVSEVGQELSKSYIVYYYQFSQDENKVNLPKQFLFSERATTIDKNLFYRKIKKYSEYLFTRQYNYTSFNKYRIRELSNFLKKKEIDLVILNQGNSAALIPELKKSYSKPKYITWMHSNFDVYVNNYYRRFSKSFIQGLKYSDAVVCLTNHDVLEIQKINTKVFQIDNPNPLKEVSISSLSQKKISFVSRINFFIKGFDFLFEIARNIPESWVISIAGAGSQDEKEDLIDQISEKGLMNKIDFVGELNSSQLVNFYVESSIFLSTSRWEGFGVSIVEAMSCGLPIVCFENEGPKEILKNGKYGVLIEKYDLKSMLIELDKLMKSIDLRREYQNLSLVRSRDFQLGVVKEKWLSVINSIVGEKN
ncbi:glycosyltransferase [Enterococcus sp. HY326]|uniref:glycosyltransferase n=1 Tax=Enterococcus sp. HY326 TaxID=2971265 RepID=UPI0022407CA9|nr:glycosyltransferase [Enterococcus sp. HY326]